MWTIIRKETLENILTLRFAIGFVACLVVFSLATYVLTQDYLLEWNQVKAAQFDNEEELDNEEVYSYVRPAIYKDPSQLAAFGSGLGKKWGRRVWISHTRVPVFTTDETSGGSAADFLAFFYDFDFTNIVQIFISLLALLFSFDLICGEKQRSTLGLVLSNPVQRTKLFIGKYVGALLALLPIILASFLAVGIIFLVNAPMPLTADTWIGLSLILLTTILYGAVFIAIGIFVSAFTHKIPSSLIVCMIVWIFLVLVLPSTIGFLSSEFGFSKDAREHDRNLSALFDEYRDRMNGLRYVALDYMLTANSSSGGEGGQIFRIVGKNAEKYYMERLPDTIDSQNEFAVKRFDLERAYKAERSRKTALTNNLLRLSPASQCTNIIDALAGTDEANHEFFMARAREYREEVIEYIRSKGGYSSKRWFTNDFEGAPYRDFVNQAETMTLREMGTAINDPQLREQLWEWIEQVANDPDRMLDLSDMPRFENEQRPLVEAFNSAMLDIFLMVVFTAVTITISYIRFLYYDPR